MNEEASTVEQGRVDILNPDGLHRNPAFSNVAVISGAFGRYTSAARTRSTPKGTSSASATSPHRPNRSWITCARPWRPPMPGRNTS